MPAVNGPFDAPADTGLLLVGHGSREPTGVREFLAAVGLVAETISPAAVEPCFLEFARPAISDGFAALLRRGARRIVVVPVFLFSAGHVKRDIPAAVAQAAALEPGASVLYAEHLGCHEDVLRLSQKRYDEAVAAGPSGGEGETELLIVGRGSYDPEATAEMRRFVELRVRDNPVRRAAACFVAMAEPRLTDALDAAAASGAARIVVQPHLLFGGVLVDRIRETVARYARRHPQIRWVPTHHLGTSDLLVQALLRRAMAVLWAARVG